MFKIVIRVVAIGTADQSRQKSRFRRSQVGNVFVEVGAGRFAKTVDRKAGLLAQINLVAIKRKNLFLRKPRFQNDRHVSFGDLAPPGSFRRQQKVLDELLRDAGTTLARDRRVGI